MKITLKDGSVKEYDSARSVYEIAADISEGLARVACAGKVDGEVVDLRTVIDRDCTQTHASPKTIRLTADTSSVPTEALYPRQYRSLCLRECMNSRLPFLRGLP